MLIRLCILHVYVTEDRKGETVDGEEPTQPAEVENMSHCLCVMSDGLQRSQPAAGAAPSVSQVHLTRLPTGLVLSSHRFTPYTAWDASPV